MKKNMGSTDKVIRLIIAIGLICLYFGNIITGTAAIIALVISVIFILTSLIGFCPIYSILGIKTCANKPEAGS